MSKCGWSEYKPSEATCPPRVETDKQHLQAIRGLYNLFSDVEPDRQQPTLDANKPKGSGFSPVQKRRTRRIELYASHEAALERWSAGIGGLGVAVPCDVAGTVRKLLWVMLLSTTGATTFCGLWQCRATDAANRAG